MRIFLSSILVYFLTGEAFAYDLISPSDMIVPAGDGDTYALSLLSNIIAYAIGIAGVLGVLGVTWGGIQMVLSSGDDEKVKKARSIIIYAFVGVLISGMAYGIVEVISSATISF